MKLELLTNATVVDDAIRFVLEHHKNEVKDISLVAAVEVNNKHSFLISYRTNHFGFGILKNRDNKKKPVRSEYCC
jgi:hypothetical protein